MNFKQFSTSDNQWHDVPYYQHKTATDTLTLPATLYPNDTSITVGLKGNTTQSDTPSPSNPVDVQGVGERTGNLFDKNDVLQGYRIGADGLPFNDGECALSDYIEVTPNTIVNQHQAFLFNNCMAEYDENKTFIIRYISGNGKITTSASTKYIRVAVSKIRLDKAMVTMGATAPTSYEPYGYKIPISSAGQTTPIYLGEVETTRKIRKYEFTGQENISLYNAAGLLGFQYLMVAMQNNMRADGLCTHFVPQITGSSKIGDGITFGANNQYLYFTFSAATISAYNLTDVESISSFLRAQYAAGTPVTVWYVLGTPTTGITNEPLMKIGNYADSLTTSIPCTAGENTLDVQTTVAPSGVTANYHGWHPVASVHERENGQWD